MDNKLIKVYVVGGDKSYTKLFLDEIKIVPKIKEADVVLFTGGEDIYPGYYGEDKGSYTSTNKERDRLESISFEEAMQYNKLCLGICRGGQLLTTLSGGALIQHVTNHGLSGTHKIHLMNEGVDIDITSTHHQMMWPFNLPKDSYVIIAKSTKDLSTTYLNGDDREKKLPSDFVECEIVYYKYTNCLCIQGHPEYMPKDSTAVRYINVLIREYLEDTVEIIPEIENEVEAPNVDDGILRQVANAGRIQMNPVDWENMVYIMNDLNGLRKERIREQIDHLAGLDDLDII